MATLKNIAEIINAKIVGDPDFEVDGIASLADAGASQISFIRGSKHQKSLQSCKSGAVILSPDLLKSCKTNALVVDNPNLAFAKISNLFKVKQASGIHPTAIISKTAKIGKNPSIGAFCIIEDGVSIGDNAYFQAGVKILQDCKLGNNVNLSPGVVIGSEGFGNVQDTQNKWHTIAHLGAVIIGDNVSIGANSAIDRGTLNDTEIHNGVRIDNLVHIAHNVVIGEDCAIAATVAFGGSATLGKGCMLGGGAVVASHAKLADGVMITGASVADRDLKKAGLYTGFTSISSHSKWMKNQIWLLNFAKIAKFLNLKLKKL